MNIGKIVQVIGPVVDVEFPSGKLPSNYNALKIKRPSDGNGGSATLTVEVAILIAIRRSLEDCAPPEPARGSAPTRAIARS